MGFKSKVIGFLAAGILSASMVAGVAAQSDNDSVSGSAVLEPGICKVSITQGSVGFGTWTYQGTGYAHTAGSNQQTLTGNVTPAVPDGSCDVTFTTGSLTGPGGVIPASHWTGSFDSGGQVPLNDTPIATGTMVVEDVVGSHSINLTLVSVPADYETGTYSGTLNVSVDAAP